MAQEMGDLANRPYFCRDCGKRTTASNRDGDVNPYCSKCGESYQCQECGYEIDWNGECQRDACDAGHCPSNPDALTPDRELTPDEWTWIENVNILDPDGWRFGCKQYPGPKDWNMQITRHEFRARMNVSTIQQLTRPKGN